MPFMANYAQELTEVMKIEMKDTVITFKVSDIKSFSFDEVEWVEEPTYELRVLTFEDKDAKFSPYSLDYAGAEITTWSDLIDDPEYGGPLCYGDYMSCEYT